MLSARPIVSRLIHQRKIEGQMDVGSRLDGVVPHLASFMEVKVFDIRKLELETRGVTFRQTDMMDSNGSPKACSAPLSCLYAIEHFGLGRYGDPLKGEGFELRLVNLAKILSPGGTLYLSCPIGENIVHFNAHRTGHPHHIETEARKLKLELE